MSRTSRLRPHCYLISMLTVLCLITSTPAFSLPERVIPPLSDILAASEYLSEGDIPDDNSSTAGMTAIYVSTDGDNGNSGLTVNAPKRNLGAAIELANSNPSTPVVIYMRGGTYYRPAKYEYLEIQRGNIMITAYQNESVTIRPHFWPNNPGSWGEAVFLYSYGPYQNITISNLTLQGWATPFVFGATFDLSAMQNIVIKNITANEFKRRSAESMSEFFSTNYVSRGYFSGRDFDPSDTGIKYQIEGLILSNIYLEGVDLPINIGDEDDANVKGLRISDVEVRNPPQSPGGSASDGFAIVNSYKVLIDNCLIDNIQDDGIDTKSFDVCVVNTLTQGTGRNAVKFWHGGELINSIIYDCTPIDDGAFIIIDGPCRMINSILMKKGVGYAGTLNYADTSSDRFEIVNSIFMDLDHTFYAGTDNLQSKNSLYYDMPAGLFSGQTVANNVSGLNALTNCKANISGDPLLANPVLEDFSITENSPCRDTGTSSGTTLPSFDYLGRTRPAGAGCDIGPYEYGAQYPQQANYVNLTVTPDTANPGELLTLSYTCDFARWNYSGYRLDIYLAAVKNPSVADTPSTVRDAISGEAVYYFRNGIKTSRTPGSPTFSDVVLSKGNSSGSLKMRIPKTGGMSGNWKFAAVFLYADGSRPVRSDGLPAENSNIIEIQ